MKLRNKKTGEIIDVYKGQILLHYNQGKKTIQFKSIEELEEWEDYEEPKQCWYITLTGEVREGILDADWRDERRIGNYFETKEEAEKAVERLRAWKRLKDKGFRFNGWEDSPAEDDFDMIWFTMKAKVWDVETQEALDLLFGGEE